MVFGTVCTPPNESYLSCLSLWERPAVGRVRVPSAAELSTKAPSPRPSPSGRGRTKIDSSVAKSGQQNWCRTGLPSMAPAALAGCTAGSPRRKPGDRFCSVSLVKRRGVAHAISPDVRSGILAFQSLDGNIASPSRLRSVSNAARLTWTTPLICFFARYRGCHKKETEA
jgi:hypothetical protein